MLALYATICCLVLAFSALFFAGDETSRETEFIIASIAMVGALICIAISSLLLEIRKLVNTINSSK